MAVQAQYPSSVLLLNRNGQEENDYSLQPQPGGFLDQSHMFFNNEAINTRKRGREEVPTPVTCINAPINTYNLQQQTQPLRLIDLSQLHNHPPQNVVSTGLRLSFGDQRQQQVQLNPHFPSQQQQQQNFSCQSPGGGLLSLVSEDLAMQIKRQRDELDQFLQAQGEQMRRALAGKRQRHYHALMCAAEESITRRLRAKEDQVEKATRRNADLEARAAQLSVEAQVWQAKARAQEAAAASLQVQLQQAITRGGDSKRGEGSSGGVEGQADDAESAHIDPDRVAVSGPSCKACRRRMASVVLLPCRHLCLCAECDRVAHACPLCLSPRNSSVEVFLS